MRSPSFNNSEAKADFHDKQKAWDKAINREQRKKEQDKLKNKSK